MKYSVFLFLFGILLSSCASVERSTLLGGVIGGTIGAVAGNAAGNTFVGTAVGGGIGSLIGYSVFQSKKNKEEKNSKLNITEGKSPALTTPKVRRVWVPARIEGDKYIDGHYMYVIEKTSSWSE